ncbi:N-acetylglucosamine kinase [Microbacterium sp. PMB16]|uniref:N-acetylglucosamine kinase n=1 Tax=Microbacterium sp. PMB16 TaxID=3120157 RepID=UPI003F4C6D70
MHASRRSAAVDLGKSRCRVAVFADDARDLRTGDGAPGLAAADGVAAAIGAIRPLLSDVTDLDLVGVGAAGAWLAPGAAQELASQLNQATGAAVAVASDVVTAHVGALAGGQGVLLIAGTGAAALGVDGDGARLIDGWGPELGDLGSGAWLGREALRAVLRASNGLAPRTALADAIALIVGAEDRIPGWLAQPGPLPRRLATLAPTVLDTARSGDPIAGEIVAEGIRLLTASAVAASRLTTDVVVHGGLTEHHWFRDQLTTSLQVAGRQVVAASGDALDGALTIARRTDLPHERFVHRAE